MKENGKYRIMHACFWMMSNIAYGYNAFYLAEFGYNTGEIGVITAAFSVAAAVMQPVLGRVADKSTRFNWKSLMLLLATVCEMSLLALAFCSSKILVGILFGVMGLMVNGMMPLLNVISFYYEKKGVHVDYGIARGIGSVAYSSISFLLGQMTVRIGTSAIPWAGVPVILILLLVTFLMPCEKQSIQERIIAQERKVADRNVEKDADNKNAARRAGNAFVRKYPYFIVLIAGSVLMMAVHNSSATFLVQILEEVGGDSSHLGTAIALAAISEAPMMFLFSRVAKKIPEPVLLVTSGLVYILKSFLFVIADNVWLIYAAKMLQPFSYATFSASSIYLAGKSISEDDEATAQALLTMCMPASLVVGNLAGGWIIEYNGVPTVLMAILVASVVATVIVAVSMSLYRKAAVIEK